MDLTQYFLWFFGLASCATALLFVTRKNPVGAALWLVLTMFNLAAMYVLLDAQFVGAVQVLVYAGAIMVVFLFVVMLLNLGQVGDRGDLRPSWTRLLAGVAGVALVAMFAVLGAGRIGFDDTAISAMAAGERSGNVVTPVASALFTDQLLAFELTSILLLVAVVGAVLLAQRSRQGPGAARVTAGAGAEGEA